MAEEGSSSSASSSSSSPSNQPDQHQQLIAQFLEIVGEAISVERATDILQSCGWHLENALAVHFAQHDEESRTSRTLHRSPSTEPLLPPQPEQPSSHHPNVPPSTTAPSPTLSSIGRAIGRYCLLIARSILSIMRILYTSFLSPALNIEAYGTFDFNPYFQTHFGSPKPQFFTGDFLQACQQAKRDRRVLLIYLHQQTGSETMCQRLFQNELFLDMAGTSAVIWATLSSRLEGHMLKRRVIHCMQLPHLSVFVPTAMNNQDGFNTLIDQSPFSTSRNQQQRQPLEGFHLVGTLEGTINDADRGLTLIANAIEFMENERLENDRVLQRLEDDRRLRLEQDEAYAAAVERDREISAKAREEEQKKQQELIKKEQRDKEEQIKKQQKEETRLRLRREQLMRGRNFFIEQLKSATPHDTIRIRVRLPDGVRLERKFERDAPLNFVFLWIDGIADLIETISEEFMNQPMTYIQTIVESDDTCRQKVDSSDHSALTSNLLGDFFNPSRVLPDIPLHFYMSSPFPVQKLERPSLMEDGQYLELKTLRQLGIESDVALFLHYFLEDDDDDEKGATESPDGSKLNHSNSNSSSGSVCTATDV